MCEARGGEGGQGGGGAGKACIAIASESKQAGGVSPFKSYYPRAHSPPPHTSFVSAFLWRRPGLRAQSRGPQAVHDIST